MSRSIILAGALVAMLPPAALAQSGAIGMPRAIEIAERATGGRTIEAELDGRRNGALVYEIELADSGTLHEVDVDARSGRIVARRTPRLESFWANWVEDDELRAVASARPLADMLRGLERRSDGRVTEVSFDVEAGQARYEVEISTSAGTADIYLDPKTGRRLSLVHDD